MPAISKPGSLLSPLSPLVTISNCRGHFWQGKVRESQGYKHLNFGGNPNLPLKCKHPSHVPAEFASIERVGSYFDILVPCRKGGILIMEWPVKGSLFFTHCAGEACSAQYIAKLIELIHGSIGSWDNSDLCWFLEFRFQPFLLLSFKKLSSYLHCCCCSQNHSLLELTKFVL